MSPPEVWGPPIWTLFHTLSCQINNTELLKPLFMYIQRICRFLPCPECSNDATSFLRKVRLADIQTVDDISMAMYLLHNHVNKKKNKSLYSYSQMNKYKSYNLIAVFKNFVRVYNTRGNMNMINDDFQRNMIISEFKKWLGTNIQSFSSTL